MSAKAKLLSLVALAGVGSVEIPFLLYREGGSSVATPSDSDNSQPQADAPPLDSGTEEVKDQVASAPYTPEIKDKVEQSPVNLPEKVDEGNCTVTIDISDDIEGILWGFGLHNDDYITFACSGTSTDSTGKLAVTWTGLFPKVLLSGAWNLKNNDKVNIKTETKSTGQESYETTFSGPELKDSSLTGTWNDSPETTFEGDKETINVQVSGHSEKPIYLVFDKTNS